MAQHRDQAIVLGIRARRKYSSQLMYHLRGSTRPKSAFTPGETRLLRGREPVVALLPDRTEEAKRVLADLHARRSPGRPPDELIEVMYAAPRFEPNPKEPDAPLPWAYAKLDDWTVACVGHVTRLAGPESVVVGAWFHSDETAPHIHAAIVPVSGGRVRWGAVKDAYARPFLRRKLKGHIDHRDAYRGIRDGYFEEVGREFGLVRGRIIWKPEDWKKLDAMRDPPNRLLAAETRLQVLADALRNAEAALLVAEGKRERAEREAEEVEQRVGEKRAEERDAEGRVAHLRKEEEEARAKLQEAKTAHEVGKRTLLGRQSERGQQLIDEAEAAKAQAAAAMEESRKFQTERDAAVEYAADLGRRFEGDVEAEKERLRELATEELKRQKDEYAGRYFRAVRYTFGKRERELDRMKDQLAAAREAVAQQAAQLDADRREYDDASGRGKLLARITEAQEGVEAMRLQLEEEKAAAFAEGEKKGWKDLRFLIVEDAIRQIQKAAGAVGPNKWGPRRLADESKAAFKEFDAEVEARRRRLLKWDDLKPILDRYEAFQRQHAFERSQRRGR